MSDATEARAWNDIVMSFGSIAALQTAANKSDIIVIPARCRLVHVFWICSVIIDAALTLDLERGRAGSETNLGALLVPSPTQAIFTAARIVPTSDVDLEEGDSLAISSNGEQTAASLGYFTGLFRAIGT